MTTYHPDAPDLTTNDYIVLGCATCFYKEDGEVHEVEIIEAIPSAALEALFQGIPTSYKIAYATTLGSVLNAGNFKIPAIFPKNAQFSEEFKQRAFAAARTYKRRETAQSLISLGNSHSDFTYSTERKRILNAARIVTKDDNVKQHSHTHQVL